MKILLLAPIHHYTEYLQQGGRHPFLIGQGQQSWYETLVRLGHQVVIHRYSDTLFIPQKSHEAIKVLLNKINPVSLGRIRRFSERHYFWNLSNQQRNKIISNLAEKEKPDIVIISGGAAFLFPATIKNIKSKYGSKIILFSGINPAVSSVSSEKDLLRKQLIDYVVTNDKGYGKEWAVLGAKKVIVLPISAADPKRHRKLKLTLAEKKRYSNDVCFVGSLTMERQKILQSLLEFDLKIWGDISPGEILSEALKKVYQGPARGSRMVKIFNGAKMVLNFQPTDMKFGGNMRTFEVPACGAFQLADRIDPDFFLEGKEYVSFKNTDDLKKKIRYYLSHPELRNKIAQAGYQRTKREHTYDHHFRKLFRTII